MKTIKILQKSALAISIVSMLGLMLSKNSSALDIIFQSDEIIDKSTPKSTKDLIANRLKSEIERTTGVKTVKIYPIFENYWRVFVGKGAAQSQTPSFEQFSQQLKTFSSIKKVVSETFLKKLVTPEQEKQWYLQKPVLSITGRLGVYGSNFQKAWGKATGKNVVVAVLDSGVINHEDLGTITPQATGAYVSQGYDFISDCRHSGSCSGNLTNEFEFYRASRPVALDTGDAISKEDLSTYRFSSTTAKGFCPNATDSSWHGTFISGIIASKNNNLGTIGAAYDTKILPIRIGGRCYINGGDWTEGLFWALNQHTEISNPHPASVVNMSISSTKSCSESGDADIFNSLLRRVPNVFFIAAAGNGNTSSSKAPADCNGVITVAAVGKSGERASYSNYNAVKPQYDDPVPVRPIPTTPAEIEAERKRIEQENKRKKPYEVVDIATGVGHTATDLITSTTATEKITYVNLPGTYGQGAGTSYAAPQVVAAIAMMKEIEPTITQGKALDIIKRTATAFANIEGKNNCAGGLCGAGVLNTDLALSTLKYGILPQVGTVQMPSSGPALEYDLLNILTTTNQIVKIESDNPDIQVTNVDCINKVMEPIEIVVVNGKQETIADSCQINIANKTLGVQKTGNLRVWTNASTSEPQLEIPMIIGVQAQTASTDAPVIVVPEVPENTNPTKPACKTVNNPNIPFPICESNLDLQSNILPTNTNGTPKTSGGGCSLIDEKSSHQKGVDYAMFGLLFFAGMTQLRKRVLKPVKVNIK